MKKMLLAMLFWMMTAVEAGDLTLNLKNTNLSDAIRFIATSSGMNVVISPSVTGAVSVSFQHAVSANALDSILASHGLAKWQVGNIWYIAPCDELIKRKQEEVKWQAAAIEAEPLLTEIWPVRYAKAEEIAKLLQDQQAAVLSKRGQVHVDGRTNSLLVQDIAGRMTMLHQLIARLDVPVRQIMIEARLASVDNDFEQQLGVHFGVRQSGASSNTLSNAISDAGRYSVAVVRLADGSTLDVKLSALELAGHAELISSPRLFTANQQPAFIESGEEVPYQEVSESGGTAVTFKKAVMGLKVTPQILPGNRVLMQLQINQDRPSARMVQGVPTIDTRQMVTSALVKSGQTVVLGGIYEVNEENGQERLPYLANIPILGALFRTQRTRQNKRELLIFVTPKIML